MKLQIPEQYLEKIKNLDEKNCFYIFIAILLFIFLLDYFVLMRPQLEALTKINPEIKILSDNLKNTKIELSKVNYYRNQVKKYKKEISKVNIKVRSKEEVPLILKRISVVANRTGVKIDHIMPISQDNEILLEDKDRKYLAVPIIIEAKSAYHDYGRFLNQLENENIFLTVQRFNMSSRGEATEVGIKLTLRTIVYEEI